MPKDNPVVREVEPPQNQGPQVVEETRGQTFADQMGISPRKVDAVPEDAEPGIYYIGRSAIPRITLHLYKTSITGAVLLARTTEFHVT